MNALLREMQLMMAQGAATASEPSIVEILPVSFSGYTTQPFTFANAVKAGDKIVFALANSSARTLSTVTDSGDNTYHQDAYEPGDNSRYVECWSTTVAADAASLTVSIKPSASGTFGGCAYILRGKTLTLDSANVLANSEVKTGGSTFTIGPYSTSGPAFVLLALITYQGSGTAAVTVGDSNFTDDYTTGTGTTRYVGHAMFTAAQSGNALEVTTPSGNNVTVARVIVPYTYT